MMMNCFREKLLIYWLKQPIRMAIVKEVIFRIDDIAVGKASSFPYHYHWNTGDAIAGRHNITATAIDNGNGAASRGIDILIVEEGSGVLETGTVERLRWEHLQNR